MVKVDTIEWVDDEAKEVKCSVIADTQAEVDDAEIDGMPEGYSIAMGSDCFTASGEIAFMKSDGRWNWVQ